MTGRWYALPGAGEETASLHHPYLLGTKIYLRGLERADITGNWFQWFNDQEVTRYMTNGAFPNSVEGITRFYEHVVNSPNDAVFAIVDRSSNAHVGNIGIHRIDWINRVGEYGTVIGEKSAWGKGFGTEATELILAHAFCRLNLHKVFLGVHAEHAAAIRLYEKVGFVHEGRMRQEVYRDGRYYDKVLMGILQEEFLSRRARGSQ